MTSLTENTFFNEHIYQTQICLEANEEILESIYEDNIHHTYRLIIKFLFITDTKEKAIKFKDQLINSFPEYKKIAVKLAEDGFWEIKGLTDKIQMTLQEINKWNQMLWDMGYKFDCQLSGWQVVDK